MKAEKVYKHLMNIKATLGKADAEVVDKLVKEGGKYSDCVLVSTLANAIIETKKALLDEASRASGKSKRDSALKSLLKVSNREDLKEPWLCDERQVFCNGYYLVWFNKDNHTVFSDNINQTMDVKKFINHDMNKYHEIALPDEKKLEAYIKRQVAEHKTNCVEYCFNSNLLVNAKFLLNMMKCMPNAVAYHDDISRGYIYFKNDASEGILLPISAIDKTKYANPTDLD